MLDMEGWKIEDWVSVQFEKVAVLGVLKVDFRGKSGLVGVKTPSGY